MMEQAQSAMRKLMSEKFWLSLYVKADMEQMSRIADEVLKTLQEFREKEGRKVSIASGRGAQDTAGVQGERRQESINSNRPGSFKSMRSGDNNGR